MKWTSWGFLAIIGSLAFLALYLKDREIKAGGIGFIACSFRDVRRFTPLMRYHSFTNEGVPGFAAIAYWISS